MKIIQALVIGWSLVWAFVVHGLLTGSIGGQSWLILYTKRFTFQGLLVLFASGWFAGCAVVLIASGLACYFRPRLFNFLRE